MKRLTSSCVLLPLLFLVAAARAANPTSTLPDERTVFGTGHTKPVNTNYFTSYETTFYDRTMPGTTNFNYNINANVHRVQIVGETVEVDTGTRAYTYDNWNTLAEMEVIAETLIIRQPWRLKGTTVHIYARELRFEGAGQIITTPVEQLSPPGTTNLPGVDGLKAGDVTLNIGTLTNASGTNLCFVLTGGRGQDGGPGQDGEDGSQLATVL